jgi:hypothetical protein
MAVPVPALPNTVTIKTADGPVSYDLGLRETKTIELDREIHALEEAMPGAPILGLMNKVGAPEKVDQPVYSMLRKRLFPRFINLGGAYTAGAATITIAAGDVGKFKRGYYVLNTLKRVLWRVNGTPAASLPVEVVGEVADSNSVGSADELLILGYRGAEFDTRFLDFVRLPDVIFNYVGEYATAYEITQYEQASGHLPGHDPLAMLRADKLEELRMNVELGILFDQRNKNLRVDADGATRVVWQTGGADSFMTQNETDFSSGLSEATLLTAFRQIRRFGRPERWGMAAPKVLEKIDGLYVGDRRLNQNIPTEVGIDINRLKYGGLTINFFTHPFYDDATSTHANSLKGTCWIFDLDDFGLTTMSSELMGFFKWFMNVQLPGTRGRSDQLIANVGVKMTLPEVHARWIGF